MIQLIPPTKVIVKTSPGRGLGCFASSKISRYEVFEECYLLSIDDVPGYDIFKDYRFNYPQGNIAQEQVLPMGFGCIYNHSNVPNASWRNRPDWRELDTKIFQFYALRDIYPGEEICTFYGSVEEYWNHRSHTQVI